MKTQILASLVAALIVMGTMSALAAPDSGSLPAVSAINAKLDMSGGVASGDPAGLVAGSLTVPVYHDFGVQLDAGGGTVDEKAITGGAVHAFYRDPSTGLVGAIAERVWHRSEFYNQFGAEGEYYDGPLTFATHGGYQNGVNHGGFSAVDVHWYATDNLALTPGFSTSGDRVWGRAAVEWQPDLHDVPPGLAIFSSAGGGNHGYSFAIAGVRYYFGDHKSLIRRQREDDPDNLVMEGMTSNASQFQPPTQPAQAPHCQPPPIAPTLVPVVDGSVINPCGPPPHPIN
jgi:hypothetical protein